MNRFASAGMPVVRARAGLVFESASASPRHFVALAGNGDARGGVQRLLRSLTFEVKHGW
jgi:hypothetical protein